MNTCSKALAEAHVADLHREAARARDTATDRAAQRDTPIVPDPVTLRLSAEADAAALTRLAALDSTEVPAAPVLVAEAGGELLAALSLRDGAVIADPFHATAPLVELLIKRADHLRGDSPRLRRIRAAARKRARRGRRGRLLAQAR